MQVTHIAVVDDCGQFHLDGDDPVSLLDDEINLVATVEGAQMPHVSVARLRVDADTEPDEMLEQRAKQRALAGDARSGRPAFQ